MMYRAVANRGLSRMVLAGFAVCAIAAGALDAQEGAEPPDYTQRAARPVTAAIAPHSVQANDAMIPVEPGTYTLGRNDGPASEAPTHPVRLQGFRIDRTEYGATAGGALDMSGSLAEWTSSLKRPNPYDPADGREAPDSAGERITRGGDYIYDAAASTLTATHRDGFSNAPGRGHRHIGFRCAADAG
ncbi:formylglycine-generating enzyme family protein [Pelagivirga sediminicola]|nr:SUMF1/EgtB/PvdO family nonheme iron enzyme [Pelagivirga sediminicola]